VQIVIQDSNVTEFFKKMQPIAIFFSRRNLSYQIRAWWEFVGTVSATNSNWQNCHHEMGRTYCYFLKKINFVAEHILSIFMQPIAA